MATVPLRSATAEQALVGRGLDDATIEAAANAAVAGPDDILRSLEMYQPRPACFEAR